MKKNYNNKGIKSEETKSTKKVEQDFYFPEHNKTIRATSLEEATKKINHD